MEGGCGTRVPISCSHMEGGRGSRVPTTGNTPASLIWKGWLSDSSWQATCALAQLEQFAQLPQDLVGSAKRWKEW